MDSSGSHPRPRGRGIRPGQEELRRPNIDSQAHHRPSQAIVGLSNHGRDRIRPYASRGPGRGQDLREPTSQVEPAISTSTTEPVAGSSRAETTIPVSTRKRSAPEAVGGEVVAVVASTSQCIEELLLPSLHGISVSGTIDHDKLKAMVGLWLAEGVHHANSQKHGTIGQPVRLTSNMFKLQMKCKDGIIIYHYDITIEKHSETESESFTEEETEQPEVKKRKVDCKALNRKVIQQMIFANQDLFANIVPVFDGTKNLYTKKMLSLPQTGRIPVRLASERNNHAERFMVQIAPVEPEKFKIQVPPDTNAYDQEFIQVLDIILRYGATLTCLPQGNAKIFKPLSEERKYLSHNKELAFGFYQSARNCEDGLMLNVNQVAGVFHSSGPMIEVVQRILGRTGIHVTEMGQMSVEQTRKVAVELKGLKFKAIHLNHCHKISDISELPAYRLAFTRKDRSTGESEKITVANYFQRTYRRLQYPNLPCVVVGQTGNERYFPLEVCNLLPDQFCVKRLHPDILARIPEETALPPRKKFRGISDGVHLVQTSGERYLNEFEISLNRNPVVVSARVLPPPKLTTANVTQTPPLRTWVLVDVTNGRPNQERYRNLATQFENKLIEIARQKGVCITPATKKLIHNYTDVNTLKSTVFEQASNSTMIFFLIPNDATIYGAIKMLGNIGFGIPTQCVRWERKKPVTDAPSMRNLLLKIKAKLGGSKEVIKREDLPLAMRNKAIMILGIDVAHPHPSERQQKPSIAACVGSFDADFVKYASTVAIQKTLSTKKIVEEITDLSTLIQKVLQTYKDRNAGKLPESIIAYRDGVSEGQFDYVMHYEVEGLLKYFSDEKQRPRLTYIVVQKGHHVRFMAQDGMNAPRGTVVDTCVTDANVSDAFIFGHEVPTTRDQQGNRIPRGTARPGRYRILFDENEFKADDIQLLTYFLCHLYCRSTQSIATPAAVKYADLLATSARIVADADENAHGLASSRSSVSNEGQVSLSAEALNRVRKAIDVHENLCDKLYFV